MSTNQLTPPIILIRGGGDIASGVAIQLFRAGFHVLISELASPLMVRRTVSFGQAVFDGTCQVEEIIGELAKTSFHAQAIMQDGRVAVLVDPDLKVSQELPVAAIVDARMIKRESDQLLNAAPIVVGLGPGFTVGKNCHAVIETKRGENLGRVYWQGSAEPDTGIPEPVNGFARERVLYSPADGILLSNWEIGDLIEPNVQIASVNGKPIFSSFRGVLRGMIQNGMAVKKGMKVGDLDPQCEIGKCYLVSDKALKIGDGVLKVLRTPSLRTGIGKTI
ncbi:MAG: selenium-dependent molybdenum cofactor biosynthesis protein YqeB [Anaerolineaceae bacterium]